MADHVAPAKRSAIMRAVRTKGSAPEMRVRQAAHRLGLRFRIHRKSLPGSPDLVFPKHRAVIFVHGCFWHRHARCRKATTPKSSVPFWEAKFTRNVARDKHCRRLLQKLGWKVHVIWQCEVTTDINAEKILKRLFPRAHR
jgi:DNA mismatch endonuclease (patch repair protein)